jgi:hypothetical protein
VANKTSMQRLETLQKPMHAQTTYSSIRAKTSHQLGKATMKATYNPQPKNQQQPISPSMQGRGNQWPIRDSTKQQSRQINTQPAKNRSQKLINAGTRKPCRRPCTSKLLAYQDKEDSRKSTAHLCRTKEPCKHSSTMQR